MKVSKLIEELEGLDPDMLVVLSKDAEGNEFYVLADTGDGDEYWDPQDRTVLFLEDDQDEEDPIPDNAQKCVVLWP